MFVAVVAVVAGGADVAVIGVDFVVVVDVGVVVVVVLVFVGIVVGAVMIG